MSRYFSSVSFGSVAASQHSNSREAGFGQKQSFEVSRIRIATVHLWGIGVGGREPKVTHVFLRK